jgi:hypothetical protein
MLNDLVNNLCGRLVRELEEGELSDAGESMLLVLALMTCQRTGLSHAMQQVRRITHSGAVHICAVRDAIRTLQRVLTLLASLVQQSPAVLNQLRGNALNEQELNQLTKINSIYAALAPAVRQIRTMLLELLAVNQNSELQYLAPYITTLLWQLFDPVGKAQPLLSPDMPVYKEKGVASAVTLMATCHGVLQRLCAVLHIVELTAGTEVFISTIKQDLMSYKSFTHNAAATLGLSSLVGRSRGKNRADSDAEDDVFPVTHTYKDLPKCLSDLIGYAIARTAYVRHTKHVQAGNYSELTWRPATVSRVLRRQLLPQDRSGKRSNSGRATEAEAVDRARLGRNVEVGLEKMEHLWDFYAVLGEYKLALLM